MTTKRKRLFILVGATVALVFIIIGILIYRTLHNKKIEHKDTSQAINNSSMIQESTDTESGGNANTSTNGTNSAPSTKPKPPTFTKSSGNNGSIPIGAVVNFVCFSEINTSCRINLTNQSGKVISLNEQAVKDNGRGENFTQWYWSSVQGDWEVVAVAKNSQGATNTSEKQNLVVK